MMHQRRALKDRYLPALLIAFVLLSGTAFGQYQKFYGYGYHYYRLMADSALGIPKDTIAIPAAYKTRAHLAAKGDSLYQWSLTQQKWILVKTDLTSYLTTAAAASTYVPYTGALGPVNLNSQTLTTTGAVSTGALSATGNITATGNLVTGTTGGGFSYVNFKAGGNATGFFEYTGTGYQIAINNVYRYRLVDGRLAINQADDATNNLQVSGPSKLLGALNVTATNVPVTVNSTNSNLYKIVFQSNGVVDGYIGSSSGTARAMAFGDAAGVDRFVLSSTGDLSLYENTGGTITTAYYRNGVRAGMWEHSNTLKYWNDAAGIYSLIFETDGTTTLGGKLVAALGLYGQTGGSSYNAIGLAITNSSNNLLHVRGDMTVEFSAGNIGAMSTGVDAGRRYIRAFATSTDAPLYLNPFNYGTTSETITGGFTDNGTYSLQNNGAFFNSGEATINALSGTGNRLTGINADGKLQPVGTFSGVTVTSSALSLGGAITEYRPITTASFAFQIQGSTANQYISLSPGVSGGIQQYWSDGTYTNSRWHQAAATTNTMSGGGYNTEVSMTSGIITNTATTTGGVGFRSLMDVSAGVWRMGKIASSTISGGVEISSTNGEVSLKGAVYYVSTTAAVGNYVVTSFDHIIKLPLLAASSYTVTLPAAASHTGRRLIIKNTDDSADAFVWTFASSVKTANGLNTTAINSLSVYELYSDGTDWNILYIHQ